MSFMKILAALRKNSLAEIIAYGRIVVRNAVGLENRLETADRILLEQTILPHYASLAEVSRILFVGTEWFTRHYESMFDGKEYWTIDADPWKRQFAGGRHIADTLQNLDRHFPPDYFQLIICNGVFGWGLDERSECEKAFGQCFERLSPGGYFLLGWNDLPQHCPIMLDDIESLQRFRPTIFPPLGVVRYMANPENRHTFNFYGK